MRRNRNKNRKHGSAHCYYLMDLGNMGLGDEGKAAGYLGEAVKIEPSHMICRVYRSLMADNG